MVMYCPRCGYPQYCGCDACKNKVPDGFKAQIYEGCIITCPSCGLSKHEDWWLNLSIAIYINAK